ncbi:MAG: FeoA family protein [Promethearchaeota archaeon]
MKKLSDIKINQKCKILSIKSAYSNKLMAMGLVPGSEIKLIRIAPAGDPLEFEVKNYFLSLRRDICKDVEVEVIE